MHISIVASCSIPSGVSFLSIYDRRCAGRCTEQHLSRLVLQDTQRGGDPLGGPLPVGSPLSHPKGPFQGVGHWHLPFKGSDPSVSIKGQKAARML